jgi:hypothetical protein
MARRNLTFSLLRPTSCAALVVMLAFVVTACRSSTAPPGLTIAGPGLQTSQPPSLPNEAPWQPEYAHLGQRLKQIGIPPGGQEKFHIHAMLRIYVNGLLRPLPADIGLDPAKGIESSLHTHDRTGIIHMEAPYPYNYTLGDFFSVWGVKLGPAQVGGLTGYGGDHLHFYLNGKPLSNPAAHLLRNGDSVVIGYGSPSTFPRAPSTLLLTEVEKGEGGLSCSGAHAGRRARPCLTVKRQTSPGSTTAR